MEKTKKVILLHHKQPNKVKLQLLSSGKIIEMNRKKFELRWDTGRYDVVNYDEMSTGVLNGDVFEL